MPPRRPAPAWLLVAGVLLLFGVWSQSFIAIEALLTTDPPRFSWTGLAVVRFALAGAIVAPWLLLARRREAAAVVRAHWRRLILSGVLMVPSYNFALYYGQQTGVPAPIASLLTALAPLFVVVLSAIFLGERITARRAIGFATAMTGLLLVASARNGDAEIAYPARIAVTALAPLSWSVYTVVSKPVTRDVSPLIWAYLGVLFGIVPLLPLLPFTGGPDLLALDAEGWVWLLHLAVLCTVLGFALWTWLLVHLPASTLGLTIFLNPPMTTGQKLALSALLPAVFAFTVTGREVAGGMVMLVGVGVAVLRRRRPRAGAAAPGTDRSRGSETRG